MTPDAGQVVLEVHGALDLVAVEPLADRRVLAQRIARRSASPAHARFAAPCTSRYASWRSAPLRDHGQQQRLGVHHPAELLEVGAHAIGVDLEPVEDVGQRAGRVGGDSERALEDEALGRASG